MRKCLTAILLSSFLAPAALADQNEAPLDARPAPIPEDVSRAVVVPGTIAFQGFLTDDLGVPITATANLDLTLYDAPSGGTDLWTETQTGISVSEGVFSLALGGVVPLGTSLFDGNPLYLGIRVDGGPEMTPRTELRSTPYAFKSFDSDNLGGLPPTSYVATTGDDMSGPLGLYGGVAGLNSGGLTEVVDSESDVHVRKYFFDAQADSWVREGYLVLSFNGVGDTPTGGAGTASVYLNNVLHTTIQVPGSGGRAWTYLVDLGTLTNFANADVFVRATSAASPVLIREISFHPGSPASAGSGNTLGEAYNEGGTGAGRSVDTVLGLPVQIAGAGGLEVHDEISVGVAQSTNGTVDVYGSSVTTPIDELTERNGGGAIYFSDDSGIRMMYAETDGSTGGGAWFGLYGNSGFSSYVSVDGNAAGSGDPLMKIHGSGSSTTFDTRQQGNASVNLPAGAVSATETWDEAGISQGRTASNVSIVETAIMQDVVTTTITIPAPGYITLSASGQTRINTSGDTSEYIGFQIDETQGGSQDVDYYFYVGWGGSAEAGTRYMPVHTQRTYFKTAGTYTFRLEARNAAGSGSKNIWNPVITAMYVPTGYGTVAARSTGGELAQFSDVERGQSGSNGSDTSSESTALVDLRELELRVAREEARLEAARRALAEARDPLNGPDPTGTR